MKNFIAVVLTATYRETSVFFAHARTRWRKFDFFRRVIRAIFRSYLSRTHRRWIAISNRILAGCTNVISLLSRQIKADFQGKGQRDIAGVSGIGPSNFHGFTIRTCSEFGRGEGGRRGDFIRAINRKDPRMALWRFPRYITVLDKCHGVAQYPNFVDHRKAYGLRI